ncbi:hypothetical protein [Sinomonas humi]|uniref:Uncharacterized protein n=1 Tax=Sinomonas humi TaxID=1338436 RepID=A0A0B2AIK2_9MICC|nr:hypothetical protein [Sinomonas humi]KHL03108.1 hypothetical protein LK10_10000 [Sinomonas humi]
MNFALFVKEPGQDSVLHLRFEAQDDDEALRIAATEVEQLRLGPAELILEEADLRRDDRLAVWQFNSETDQP